MGVYAGMNPKLEHKFSPDTLNDWTIERRVGSATQSTDLVERGNNAMNNLQEVYWKTTIMFWQGRRCLLARCWTSPSSQKRDCLLLGSSSASIANLPIILGWKEMSCDWTGMHNVSDGTKVFSDTWRRATLKNSKAKGAKRRARSHGEGDQAHVRDRFRQNIDVYESLDPIVSPDFNLLQWLKAASFATLTLNSNGNMLESQRKKLFHCCLRWYGIDVWGFRSCSGDELNITRGKIVLICCWALGRNGSSYDLRVDSHLEIQQLSTYSSDSCLNVPTSAPTSHEHMAMSHSRSTCACFVNQRYLKIRQ